MRSAAHFDALWFAFGVFIVTGNNAEGSWSCPHGQIFRVHLKQCFDAGSPMARAYAEATRTMRARGRRLPIEVPGGGVETRQIAPHRPLEPPPVEFSLPELGPSDWIDGPPIDNLTRAKLMLRGMLSQQEGASK